MKEFADSIQSTAGVKITWSLHSTCRNVLLVVR